MQSGPDPEGTPESGGGRASALQRRARVAVLVLVARTVGHQLVVLGGQVYLARVLGPAEFGVFWIVQFALAFFTIFGDAGLGAALIQKREAPTQRELSTVWWTQVGLSAAVVAIVFATADQVMRIWPDLPAVAPWLLRVMSIELLLTVLRVVPSILMEREMQFGKLSVVEVVMTLGFYVSAVALAAAGYGVTALVTAVLVQGSLGVVLVYIARPWRPSFAFDTVALGPMLRFGAIYQTKGVVGFLNGAVVPIYGGGVLGKYAFGLVTWSQNTAFFPIKLVEIVGRVNFPLFSRLQDDRRAFAESLERSIQLCAIATLFFVALVAGIGPQLVAVIWGDKWMPAVPTLYVYAAAISIGFLSPVVAGAFDALGRPQVMTRLSIAWTAFNWIAVVIALRIAPTPMAFAVGYCLHVVIGNAIVVLYVRRLLPDARLWPRVRASLVAAVAMALLVRATNPAAWVTGPFTLIVAVLGAVASFALVVLLVDRSAVSEVRTAVERLRRR